VADPVLPPIDYTSRDWISLRTDLINAARARMPEWTSDSPNDFGVVLVELFAYVGDVMSFYADRVANESYLDTAVLRSSVLAHARLLDYRPTGMTAAFLTVQFTTTGAAFIPAGTRVQTVADPGATPIVFETVADLTITAAGTAQVTAMEGQTVLSEVVGISTGADDQDYGLFQSPVIDGSPWVFVDEGNGALQWAFYDHLIDAGPADTAYTAYTDDGGITHVVFGDNVNGRVPVNGAMITVTYRVGAGAAGNVGIGAVTQLAAPVIYNGVVQPITGITNNAAGIGGADPESLDSIRANAPKSLSTINRAVTVNDYEALALRAGQVGKASASAVISTNVSLYLAPASAAGTLAPNVKQAVLAYLDGRKMIGTTVTIYDPVYLPINITVDVAVLPTYKRETVRQAVENAVRAVLAYDSVDFGSRVGLSKVYRAINSTEGVDYGTVSLLSTGTTGLADVTAAANQIPVPGIITVTSSTGGIV
jgi:Baseplate J-like protein